MQVLTSAQLAAAYQSLPSLHSTRAYPSRSSHQQPTFVGNCAPEAAPTPQPLPPLCPQTFIPSILMPIPTPVPAAQHAPPPLINSIISFSPAPAAQPAQPAPAPAPAPAFGCILGSAPALAFGPASISSSSAPQLNSSLPLPVSFIYIFPFN